MTALLSVVGSIAQDIHVTLKLRQNLRKLIEAELDNLGDGDLNEHYVKTLQELNISSFKKNQYLTNGTVQLVFSPQCDVGISWTFQGFSKFVFKILIYAVDV